MADAPYQPLAARMRPQRLEDYMGQRHILALGKPLREARGSVQEAIDTAEFFVSEGRRLYGQTVPSELRDKELFTYRRPIGSDAHLVAWLEVRLYAGGAVEVLPWKNCALRPGLKRKAMRL